MSTKPKILIQLDPDKHASAFDAVVAVDAGIQHLLQYSSVTTSDVRNLVHGSIFTRGVEDLKSTAIFVGGSDVAVGEALFQEAINSFFGPMRVSVMLDSNGANSTAAAAILCTEKHIPLRGATLLVAAATGPVGRRVCRMGAGLGARVLVHSRSLQKASSLCEELTGAASEGELIPISNEDPSAFEGYLKECHALIACGAAGASLLSASQLAMASELKVAVDLNAVPPAGIEGIKATDKGVTRGSRIDYGALGVGGLKMKIHKGAIGRLFESNQAILDAEQMLEIGRSL